MKDYQTSYRQKLISQNIILVLRSIITPPHGILQSSYFIPQFFNYLHFPGKTFYRFIFTFLLILSTSGYSNAQVRISGQLSGILEDTTYIVTDDIYIASYTTLEIESGAIFLFEDDVNFDINGGTLRAYGTEEDSIIFRLNNGAQSWGGINFNRYSSVGCQMEYCVVSGSNSSGIFCAEVSEPEFYHCTIRNNTAEEYGGGLFVRSTFDVVIDHCIIEENEQGGIFFDEAFNSILSNSVIRNNDGGGIIKSDFEQRIIDCEISGNTNSENGGGITSIGLVGIYFLTRCLVADNFSYGEGGGIFHNNIIFLSNCTVVNNEASGRGGGLYSGDGSCIITNSIFAYNRGEGGVFLTVYGSTNMFNNDFYVNEDTFFIHEGWDTLIGGLGNINTVNLNGDSCDRAYNIFKNPLFSNLDVNDFSLQSVSPCIDAGSPDSLDPDSTIRDIGAFYYDQLNLVEKPFGKVIETGFRISNIYPNPFNSIATLRFDLPKDSHVTLKIYNLMGRSVMTIIDRKMNAGFHKTVVDMNNLASGLYFYSLQGDDFRDTRKMMLLK